MFKSFLLFCILSMNLLLAETVNQNNYVVFSSETNPGMNKTDAKKTIIFEGDYKSFSDELQKGLKGGAVRSSLGFLIDGVQGAGFGLIIGLIDPFVANAQDDQRLLRITMYKTKKEVSFIKTMIVCDKNPSLSDDKAKKIFNEKEGVN